MLKYLAPKINNELPRPAKGGAGYPCGRVLSVDVSSPPASLSRKRGEQGGEVFMFRNKGFTLVEMLVAIFVFSIIIGVVIGIFVSSVRLQRRNLAHYELLNQTSYVMEYMSRVLRMAKKDSAGNCIELNKNYLVSGSSITFLNYEDKCQEFALNSETEQLKVRTSTDDTIGNLGEFIPLTSSALKIKNFNISLLGDDSGDKLQPRVTIFLEIEGRENTKLKIQTTVSQRNLDM